MNDTNVQVFRFEPADAQVRLVLRDGSPWFVASDLAHVLGLGRQQDATRHLDEDERQLIDTDTVPTSHTAAVSSKNPQTLVVSEAGMYSLILRSRKPQAKVFKRWVTHEVLPAIRKTGRFEVTTTRVAVPRTADVLRALADEVEAREEAERRLAIEQDNVRALMPFHDAMVAMVIPGDTIDVGAAAKILSDHNVQIGRNRLYQKLEDFKWVFKDRHGKRQAFQSAVTQKLLVCKLKSTFRVPVSGDLIEQFDIRFTKKGLVKMYYLLGGL